MYRMFNENFGCLNSFVDCSVPFRPVCKNGEHKGQFAYLVLAVVLLPQTSAVLQDLSVIRDCL